MTDNEGEQVAEVIPLFKREPTVEEREHLDQEVLHDLLTEELIESLLEVENEIREVWHAESEAEFREMIQRLKDKAARWPGTRGRGAT